MNKNDLRFMPETAAAEAETTPLVAHLILWTCIICIIVFIVWANFAEIDEVARAEGRVIPSSQIQVIQNLEGGILLEVLIKTGQTVTQGQTLMRLDDTRFASSLNDGQLTFQALNARIARLSAEIKGQRFVMPDGYPQQHMALITSERSLFMARQTELKSSLDILGQQLTQHKQSLAELEADENKLSLNADLAEQELSMTQPLVETGAVSQVELLRLQLAVNESKGRLTAIRLAIPRAQAVIAEARERVTERNQIFKLEAQAELNEAEQQLSRASISNVALKDRVYRTEVRSPVDGTVKQILVNTRGAVIQPGMDLIEIVPSDDTLLIEAKIRPADIAFLHPGQKATVKLSAYDFAIYGGLESVLELISADTITDERGEHYFQIQVRTDKTHLGNELNPLPIIPGMVATVDIMTGKKTVMDYLLKPLKRAQANALSER